MISRLLSRGHALIVMCVAAIPGGSVAWGAGALDALTSHDAAGGLRAALSQGIDIAVAQLGTPNGFLNDPKVMIPLPAGLEKADRALRMVGMGGEADKLKAALQKMTLADAKGILTGGDDAGTQYFRRVTSDQLTTKFKPTIARETGKLQLAPLYDKYAGKAAELGLVNKQDRDLNDYVTSKALDGLFSRIADEERAIRKDPLGQANSLIKKVFGAVH